MYPWIIFESIHASILKEGRIHGEMFIDIPRRISDYMIVKFYEKREEINGKFAEVMHSRFALEESHMKFHEVAKKKESLEKKIHMNLIKFSRRKLGCFSMGFSDKIHLETFGEIFK